MFPTTKYVKAKKYSALPEFLKLFFKPYGLGEYAYLLSGFTPPKEFNEIIKKGDFFTEDRIGAGLFHNKFTHQIQLFMILCMIQDKKIQLSYATSDKTTEKINIKDILDGLVTITGIQNISPWSLVMDAYHYYSSSDNSYLFVPMSFTNPYQLGSFIMCDGYNKMEVLSGYLKRSFFEGLSGFIKAHHSVAKYAHFSLSDVKAMMKDTMLNVFKAPPHLLEYSKNKRKKEEKSQEEKSQEEKSQQKRGSEHQITIKHYFPNQCFAVKKFDPEEQLVKLNNRKKEHWKELTDDPGCWTRSTRAMKVTLLQKIKTKLNEDKPFEQAIAEIRSDKTDEVAGTNIHLLFDGETDKVMEKIRYGTLSKEEMIRQIDIEISRLDEREKQSFWFFDESRRETLGQRMKALGELKDNLDDTQKISPVHKEILDTHDPKLLAAAGFWRSDQRCAKASAPVLDLSLSIQPGENKDEVEVKLNILVF